MSFSEMCHNFNNRAGMALQNIAHNVSDAIENVKNQGQLLGRKIDATCVYHLGPEKTEMIYRIFKNLPLAAAFAFAPQGCRIPLSFCYLTSIVLVENQSDLQRGPKIALKIVSLIGTCFVFSAARIGVQLLQSHPGAQLSLLLWHVGFAAWTLSVSNNIRSRLL